LVPLYQEIQYSLGRLNAVTQIFKIVAPFVFLSAAFATLNARLGMPPFALFLIALSLTDGAATCCLQPKDRTSHHLFFGSQ
jgi:phosphatidylinositol glycan class N